MVDNSKIAIVTTAINFPLYEKTSLYFPKNTQRFLIDGSNGMHGMDSLVFMFNKLKSYDVDWLIMADEDVLFMEPNEIASIIERMKTEGAILSGVRDGGVIRHRLYNPWAINTFFSVVNFVELKKIWDFKEIKKNYYVEEREFDDELNQLPFTFDVTSLKEPYYCFYFWLRRKGEKLLFLDAQMHSDGISNYVYFNNKRVLCHTWYARSYGNNVKHTQRIDTLLNVLLDNRTSNDFIKPILFKDKTYKAKKTVLKYFRYLQLYLNNN